MVGSNTETRITVTYQDADGTIDFSVDNDLSNYDNSSSGFTTASSTTTFTNKTLTSPKVNEDVAVTATATEINLLDCGTATTAELNHTDGVTDNIQTQSPYADNLDLDAQAGFNTADTSDDILDLSLIHI